jgi:sec-independent protein translocase protein TatA
MEETDNMPRIGGWEWVIVLVIVLLIFGVGRLSKVGRELGEGIREFRKGLTGGEDGNGENQEEI